MASTENYDGDGKVLNCIKTVYVNSLAYVRVRRCESECFRIDSGVRQTCVSCPLGCSLYIWIQ